MEATRLVDVDDLTVGMYVASLDRPWLETPFLFQGFYIRDQDEIDQLRAHCKQVYVSVDDLLHLSATKPQLLNPRQSRGKASRPKKKKFSLRALFKRKTKSDIEEPLEAFDQTGVIYKDQVTLKEELHTATGVHKKALLTIQDVMSDLRRSGSLDVARVEETVTPMVDSVLRNPAAMACLMRMQKVNEYLYHHSIASSIWATILGRQIGLQREDLDIIATGALLLDVGKTQLPTEILEKPKRLSEKEHDFMRRHVQFGLDILTRSGNVDGRVLDMVAHHHERHNGTGYPQGLKGTAIPVFGRIAGIVDAYDAMITPRPYAPLLSSFDALRKLRVLADVEFQSEIVEQFTRAIGVFPTGTLVELNTGEVGVVTQQNRIRRLRPRIMIIMGADKQILEEFQVLDLNEQTVSPDSHHSLWIECGLSPGTYGIDPTEFYLE